MARKPFDPSTAAGGLFDARPSEPPDTRPQARPMQVREVAAQLKSVLMGMGRLQVEGEVSDPSDGRHCYFQLKDAEAVIGCVIWNSQLARMASRPTQGARVVAEGHFEFYAPGGRLNFIVRSLQALGQGDLEARFQALCQELRGLGWFDAARKRPLPMLPRGIAIVTSLGGDALQDCLRTSEMRFPGVPITVIGVPVQGPGAAEAVARALDAVNAAAGRLGVDVVVVTRGGGSREDLQAFNERVVAEAVHRSELPVVSAIGHEADITVIDLVADHRASTPTQAMMAVLPDRGELREQLAGLVDRLRLRLVHDLATRRRHLESIVSRPCLRQAAWMVTERRRAVSAVVGRLSAAVQARRSRAEVSLARVGERLSIQRPAARLAVAAERLRGVLGRLQRARVVVERRRSDALRSLEQRLRSVSPTKVLGRGYSITLDASGRAITDAAAAPPGSVLTTRLATGSIRSRVEPAG
jgi:exodeoxyribonuclease VII large subunit